jgi:hypothetical protein
LVARGAPWAAGAFRQKAAVPFAHDDPRESRAAPQGDARGAGAAALDALEEVERYARTLKVLRERNPQKSEGELMESLATIKEGDEAIKRIRERFKGVSSEEIEREAVKAVREVRAEAAAERDCHRSRAFG